MTNPESDGNSPQPESAAPPRSESPKFPPTQQEYIPAYPSPPPSTYPSQGYAEPSAYLPPSAAPYGMTPVYLASPPTSKSTASMWIGIVSLLFGFTFFLPLFGLVLGILGARTEPTGRTMAVTGIILNSLFLAGWLLALLIVFPLFIWLFTVAVA